MDAGRDTEIGAERGVAEFNSSLAGLSEIVVFAVLGLTVDLGALSWTTWRDGAVLVLVLAIRPLVVVVAHAARNPRELARRTRAR